MINTPKIIVALDFPTAEEALAFVTQVTPEQCALKVGKELFTAAGPEFVKLLVAKGFKIFLDLKFHDIPNTVAKACVAAAKLGVWMINVHALGGKKMMQAAKQALDKLESNKPLLIAVTILTSTADEDLAGIGLTGTTEDNVLRLAQAAKSTGLDGVVCSAREASLLREQCGDEFCLVTPGVRPAGYAKQDDQERVMAPAEALAAGSSYLVIGRPITQADDPIAVLNMINSNTKTVGSE